MTDLALIDTDRPPPWERHPKESAKAYAMFREYRDMPTLERSLRELGRRHDRGLKQLAEWSRKYDWVARAEAHDEHLDRVALLAKDERVAELQRLRVDFAVEALTTVLSRVRGDEKSGVKPLDVGTLSAKDIAALANAAEKVGASMDRLAEGSDGNRDVNVKLSFNLAPTYGSPAPGEDVIDVPVHAELPEGDE